MHFLSDESLSPPARRLHADACDQLRRRVCWLVMAIAVVVIAGWALQYPLLKSVLPGAVAMKPNTAVALCLAAVSLLLFTRAGEKGRSLRARISITTAITAAIIGLLTLVEHLTGHGLGIDELLFRDDARGASPRYPPGRMAPITAFNFLTLGLALVFIHWRKTTLWAQALTGCAAFTSLLAIVGYVFGVETLYRSGNFTAVAINTAVSFIALCTGVWCATHSFGFMRVITGTGVSGLVVRRFGLAALVLPLVISWTHLQGQHGGWFEADFGEAVFAMINVVTFALLIWLGAVSLRKAEAKEAVIQERLRCAHLELEDRVQERTRALETALHVNQQIMDYSLDIICIIDAEGRFITVSAASAKLWGYAPAEIMGRRFMEFVHPDDHEKTTQTAMDIIAGEVVRDFENRYVRKDGSTVFMTWSVYWSPDEKLMFCVARDATERKRSEEALRHATEAAERANRAKSEFLANMSHEIRTPMNGILGMTELTLDTELNREQREYLGMVKTSAHSLLGVINDILDFSKIEAGKLDMELLSFSLRDAVGSMLKPLGVRADEKQLELLADIPANVPDHLIGDPMRLRQILLNLTDNAIKFTAQGEVVVKVVAESTADGETEFHFSVTDTGIGIPEEKQASIFEAFAQVDGSTTRHYGGTGLGLAIATRLVQQMRGRIWVESRLGFGTTFHFTIWLATCDSPVPTVKQMNPAGLDGLRVLIVDDNAVNCRVLEEMLTNWRMKPVAVRSARAALETMRTAAGAGHPFPLVLLDAMMPEMDGFGLAASIKQEPRLAKSTVMMLSSAMRSGQTSRANDLGIHSVLTKPVMQSELLDGILLALSSNEHAALNEARTETAPSDLNSGQLTVLVAEDNAINRAVISGMLGKLGHTLTHAVNGCEAVEAVTAHCFDLVLMDVQMPEMDGFEATTRIRQIDESTGRHTRIVAMTAHAMTGDRERCLAAGMDDYLSKPLQKTELLAVLDQVAIARTPNNLPAKPASGQSPKHPISSRAKLLGDLGEDEELLQELIELFHENTPHLLDKVRSSIAREHDGDLALSAHALLSSFGVFGAMHAHGLARQLEELGRGGQASAAPETFRHLESETARVGEALEKMARIAA